MSIDYEHDGQHEAYVPLRRRSRRAFTSMEEAIAYVREAVDEVGPWPEEFEVVEASALEGRLEEVTSASRTPEATKAHAVAGEVRRVLEMAGMMPRIPQLALVSCEQAELLWVPSASYRIVTGERRTERGIVLGVLEAAGGEGMSERDLADGVARALRESGRPLITRARLVTHLLHSRCDGLIENGDIGWWRMVPGQAASGESGEPQDAP